MPRLSLASRAAITPTPSTSVGTKPSPRTERLMRQRLDVERQLIALRAKAKVLDAKLLPLAKAEAVPDAKGARRLSVEGEGKLVLVGATNRYLDPKLLVIAGVRAKLIAKCTRETPYEYVRAYPEGSEEE